MSETGIGHLTGVVIDVSDLERAGRFWGAVLGESDPGRFGQYLFFKDVGGGIGLGLQQVPEPKAGKGRTHIDIGVPDLDIAASQVVELGGRQLETVEEDGGRFIVMRDPDGNEFCLVRRGPK
ncbi:MAG: VOC family protein [Chloroflexi bacterium]|nr:VOC family protein [Chloroflexota bacterium]